MQMIAFNQNNRSNTLAAGGGSKPQRFDLASTPVRSSGRTYGDFEQALGNKKPPPEQDWRVRISLPPQSQFAYAQETPGQLMFPLQETVGVVFPFTPTMTIQHNARYNEQALVHSNYKSYTYEGSDVAAITLAGVFTCQNSEEALYLMSSIQFLRACTKMQFGRDNPKAGTPPTLVRLQGYGSHYLPYVNCVVTSVSHSMPDDCDYVKYNIGIQGDNVAFNQGRNLADPKTNSSGYMPTSSTLTVVLQPVVSREKQSLSMKLDDFVRGSFITGELGTSPGTQSGGML